MFDYVHKTMEMMVCITSEITFIDIKCYFIESDSTYWKYKLFLNKLFCMSLCINKVALGFCFFLFFFSFPKYY